MGVEPARRAPMGPSCVMQWGTPVTSDAGRGRPACCNTRMVRAAVRMLGRHVVPGTPRRRRGERIACGALERGAFAPVRRSCGNAIGREARHVEGQPPRLRRRLQCAASAPREVPFRIQRQHALVWARGLRTPGPPAIRVCAYSLDRRAFHRRDSVLPSAPAREGSRRTQTPDQECLAGECLAGAGAVLTRAGLDATIDAVARRRFNGATEPRHRPPARLAGTWIDHATLARWKARAAEVFAGVAGAVGGLEHIGHPRRYLERRACEQTWGTRVRVRASGTQCRDSARDRSRVQGHSNIRRHGGGGES